MYRLLPRSRGNILGYHFSGRFTKEEVAEIHQQVRDVLERQGSVRLLAEIANLRFPEARAIWEDLKLTSVYLKDVERYAVVGDATWHAWLTTLTGKLTRGEARYFKPEQLEEAWAWIES
jgi:hypothetical protein